MRVKKSFFLTAVILIIPYAAILFTRQNSSTSSLSDYAEPSIHSTLPPEQLEIVLSYHKENVHYVAQFIQHLRNVSNLQKRQASVIVYLKDSTASHAYLATVLQADVIKRLPNRGREGATYLYHIIKNYNNLATHTIFCQAGVEGVNKTGLDKWLLHRLDKQFNSSVGYMPLVHNKWIGTYKCEIDTYNGLMDKIPQLWAIIQQKVCPPTEQAVAYRGQFLVSAQRIRRRSLELYKYLYSLLMANETHWIHNNTRYRSTPNDPVIGHAIERMWTTVFHCTKPDLRARCRRNECACFD